MVTKPPNKITGANAGGAPWFPIWTRWAALIAQFCRSPNMRAQRVKPKSRRDDAKIAQCKRRAALGSAGKMVSTPFSKSVFAPKPFGAKTDLEKGVEGGFGVLPRAATSTALPWAIIMLPLRGAGGENPAAAPDGPFRTDAIYFSRKKPGKEHKCIFWGDMIPCSDPATEH